MKARPNECVGGGYFVFRRGKRTNRVATPKNLPFEHPTFEAARDEAQRLTEQHPGEEFIVVGQMHRTKAVATNGEAGE